MLGGIVLIRDIPQLLVPTGDDGRLAIGSSAESSVELDPSSRPPASRLHSFSVAAWALLQERPDQRDDLGQPIFQQGSGRCRAG